MSISTCNIGAWGVGAAAAAAAASPLPVGATLGVSSSMVCGIEVCCALEFPVTSYWNNTENHKIKLNYKSNSKWMPASVVVNLIKHWYWRTFQSVLDFCHQSNRFSHIYCIDIESNKCEKWIDTCLQTFQLVELFQTFLVTLTVSEIVCFRYLSKTNRYNTCIWIVEIILGCWFFMVMMVVVVMVFLFIFDDNFAFQQRRWRQFNIWF